MRAVKNAAVRLRTVLGQPPTSGAAVGALEAIGAHTLADRLDRLRSNGDLVSIAVPAGAAALRSRRFRMYALGGRDQVVRALRAGGWNAFESPLPSVVVQLVRRWPQTFLDVGANTGLYSLIAVTAHPRAKAVAYEPVPEIMDLLRHNVDVNKQGVRVAVRALAVGERTGTAELHLPPPQADGTIETSASLEPEFKESIDRVVVVEAATIDDAWTAEGRPEVPLVKVDVEGAEHRVLAGATELVAASRPVLTIEVLPGAEVDALDGFRRDHGYIDVTLNPCEAVVNRPQVRPDPMAPNHLLVPQERLADVVEELRAVPTIAVVLLD